MIPGSANPLLLRTAVAGGYSISRSLRFNSSDSAFCSRTPASAGNRKTWTWAGWVKRSSLSTAEQMLFSAQVGATSIRDYLQFSNNKLYFTCINSSNSIIANMQTESLYRDPGAWMHVVLSVDTTQATDSNRIKLYVNGTQLTAFSLASYPTQNLDFAFNDTRPHTLAAGASGTAWYFDGYLADIHFIDGQALTPTSFGEFDTNGIWQPKAYTGTYGTNGFRLPFSDNSAATATTLGKDTSGNGNNWTPNNLSVTAGAGNDSLVDSPTNGTASSGGDAGGTVVGNYATWNPLALVYNTPSLSNGNLDSANNNSVCVSTIGIPPTGKWYCEVSGTHVTGGISPIPRTTYIEYYLGSGVTGVIGIAVNRDADEVKLYKDNVLQSTTSISGSGIATSAIVFIQSFGGGTLNAGQRPFAYAAPAGFKSLNTANLPTPTILKGSSYFDTKLYTGNGSTQTISGLAFSPDLVWTKSRSSGLLGHRLQDAVRGATKELFSNSTAAENTNAQSLTSFNSDGFSIGSENGINQSGETFAAWCWDAGTTTSSNGSGSITSTVRANASAGFSVVTWSGVAGANGTIGHGLGVVPQFVILKNRTTADNWRVYHVSVGATGFLQLASTGATVTSDEFQNTTPTSSVFYLRGNTWNAASNNYVGYFFAPVSGYSSFGSYTGNGSADGPFVYTGFRPRWVMVKSSSYSNNTIGYSWCVFDTQRNTANVMTSLLLPNAADSEYTVSAIDALSNGFKLRDTNTSRNESGVTYIYAAFAENPFQISRAR